MPAPNLKPQVCVASRHAFLSVSPLLSGSRNLRVHLACVRVPVVAFYHVVNIIKACCEPNLCESSRVLVYFGPERVEVQLLRRDGDQFVGAILFAVLALALLASLTTLILLAFLACAPRPSVFAPASASRRRSSVAASIGAPS